MNEYTPNRMWIMTYKVNDMISQKIVRGDNELAAKEAACMQLEAIYNAPVACLKMYHIEEVDANGVERSTET